MVGSQLPSIVDAAVAGQQLDQRIKIAFCKMVAVDGRPGMRSVVSRIVRSGSTPPAFIAAMMSSRDALNFS